MEARASTRQHRACRRRLHPWSPALRPRHRLDADARTRSAGKIVPRLDPHRFTLADVDKAHALIENRQAHGKIVVDVNG
ncbi:MULTISPECIES: zinc-binding dehydrogenase [Rhizobium]|uniref:zinc-binding dehydrogenase n=1 Tax=Rhizobium TaxID=379 RepID=UPI000D14DC0B|nr:zinc-binding dehydrogenase [Rhizobium paranaense]PST64229.1 hypothetical protein C9E91_04235 [Rhizobium sp. SEMIA4064]